VSAPVQRPESVTELTPAPESWRRISAAKSHSYKGGRMHGLNNAVMPAGSQPNSSCMHRKAAGTTPNRVPFAPAWTRPITLRCGSAKNTAQQSAV
jgi:hypothetical protein